MATINVNVVAGQNTYGRTKQISGQDLQNRFIPAFRALYSMTRLSTDPVLTDEEVVQHWADQIMYQIKQRIQEYERTAAVIPPLDLT
jgi:Tfp pilus assembly PilM family ATPase